MGSQSSFGRVVENVPATEQIAQTFQNEHTFWRLKQAGKLEEFHRNYEASLARVRKEIGWTYHNIIAGKRTLSKGGTFDDTNPSDARQVLGKFPLSTPEETRQAIDAAVQAFPAWSGLDSARRVALLRRTGDLMRSAKYEFAAWMTLENGKNRVEAMNDVDEAIDFLTYYPLVYERNEGFRTPMYQPFPNEECISLLKPFGAWAVIAPFNFPVAIAVGMTTGAILTGNTAVLKPASDTPLVGFKFVELLEKAGLPPGVVNFVTGAGGVVGQALLDSPRISGVVFTGSREVGLRGIEASSKRGRPFIAEMGGKNPIIVTSHADLDAAVEGVARSAYGYGGQKCSACSRVYVQSEVRDEFVGRFLEWARQNAKVGDPTQRDVLVGPVITRRAHDQFLDFVKRSQDRGKILIGGRSLGAGPLANGHFVEPTLVDGLPDDHWITQNELFVPFLSLYTFRTLEEGVRRANAVPYGLTAGIFSQDANELDYFFNHIESGVTYANRRVGGSTGAIVGGQSFVGWKASGSSGRGAGGPWYLQQFLREQSQTRVT